MCQLLCSASVSLPGSPLKSARVFCRRISTTQSPMSRARKRYPGRDRSEAPPIAHARVYRTAQRWLDQIDPVGAARLVSLQSIENYLNRLGRERADQSSLPATCSWRAGLTKHKEARAKVNQGTEGRVNDGDKNTTTYQGRCQDAR